jgi:hypothetical protein
LTVFVSPPRGAQYDIPVDFFKVEDFLLGFVVVVTLLAEWTLNKKTSYS